MNIVQRAELLEALSEERRAKIPKEKFVFKSKKRKGKETKGKYPIDTRERARSALRLVGMHGTDAEKARVRSAVKAKYGIGESDIVTRADVIESTRWGREMAKAIKSGTLKGHAKVRNIARAITGDRFKDAGGMLNYLDRDVPSLGSSMSHLLSQRQKANPNEIATVTKRIARNKQLHNPKHVEVPMHKRSDDEIRAMKQYRFNTYPGSIERPAGHGEEFVRISHGGSRRRLHQAIKSGKGGVNADGHKGLWVHQHAGKHLEPEAVRREHGYSQNASPYGDEPARLEGKIKRKYLIQPRNEGEGIVPEKHFKRIVKPRITKVNNAVARAGGKYFAADHAANVAPLSRTNRIKKESAVERAGNIQEVSASLQGSAWAKRLRWLKELKRPTDKAKRILSTHSASAARRAMGVSKQISGV